MQLEAKALGKLYGIEPDDEDYFKPPKRNREDIKRSRSDCVRDEHFSKTAARRRLEEDLFSEENEWLSAAIGITGRYLEVSLLHTKPLGDIPEELLPERKKTARET